MKKMTQKVAQRLSNAYSNKQINTFQEVIDRIKLHTEIGFNTCFVDSSKSNLIVIKAELEERGFTCHWQQLETGDSEDTIPFLSVEW